MKDLSNISDKDLMDEYEKISTDYTLYLSEILKRETNKIFESSQNSRFIELQTKLSVYIVDKLGLNEKELSDSYKSLSDIVFKNDR